jgi:hypothetical protein
MFESTANLIRQECSESARELRIHFVYHDLAPLSDMTTVLKICSFGRVRAPPLPAAPGCGISVVVTDSDLAKELPLNITAFTQGDSAGRGTSSLYNKLKHFNIVFRVCFVQARASTRLVLYTRTLHAEAQPDPPRGSERWVASHVVTH